eukprot:COSAG05_NODE_13862_length_416_cov_0.652997_1_plen_72_part_01
MHQSQSPCDKAAAASTHHPRSHGHTYKPRAPHGLRVEVSHRLYRMGAHAPALIIVGRAASPAATMAGRERPL